MQKFVLFNYVHISYYCPVISTTITSTDNTMSSVSSHSSSRDSNRVRRSPSSSTSSEHYVEVAVVADHTMLEYHGTRELEAYLFTLMNMVRYMCYTQKHIICSQCLWNVFVRYTMQCIMCIICQGMHRVCDIMHSASLVCRMWLWPCSYHTVYLTFQSSLQYPLPSLSFLSLSCFTHQVAHLYRDPSIGHAMNIVVVRTVILETEQVCHLLRANNVCV